MFKLIKILTSKMFLWLVRFNVYFLNESSLPIFILFIYVPKVLTTTDSPNLLMSWSTLCPGPQNSLLKSPACCKVHSFHLLSVPPIACFILFYFIFLNEGAGIPVADEPKRGLDHGVFVPFKLIFPDADIPTLQVHLTVCWYLCRNSQFYIF